METYKKVHGCLSLDSTFLPSLKSHPEKLMFTVSFFRFQFYWGPKVMVNI